jgi:hypothetical protein
MGLPGIAGKLLGHLLRVRLEQPLAGLHAQGVAGP